MTNANPQQTIVRDLAYKANNPPNVNRVTDNINSFILFIFYYLTEKNVNHQYSVPSIYQRVSRTSIFE